MATILAFFNNTGGVGTTSLVYHLAWMYAERGVRVVAADLDPQANLTAAFLDDEDLERLWADEGGLTVYGAIRPLAEGFGDVAAAHLERIGDHIALVAGDLRLSGFEDELSAQWPASLDGNQRAFRVVSAFSRVLQRAADDHDADLVLLDVGPNLGAINRAALVATDRVVIPLSPDLFSLQGLTNLGPTLVRWRDGWRDRLQRQPSLDFSLPSGDMLPIGYVVLQHGVRLHRPVSAYERWMTRIPTVYRQRVLREMAGKGASDIQADSNCLALLKHYHSLVPMSQEARKPLFLLRSADGAIGAHQRAVGAAYDDFFQLSEAIDGGLAARSTTPR